MIDKPLFVNVPEGKNGANIYREMNAEEYAIWEGDVAAVENTPKAINPVISAVKTLSDDEKKELLAVLGVN